MLKKFRNKLSYPSLSGKDPQVQNTQSPVKVTQSEAETEAALSPRPPLCVPVSPPPPGPTARWQVASETAQEVLSALDHGPLRKDEVRNRHGFRL